VLKLQAVMIDMVVLRFSGPDPALGRLSRRRIFPIATACCITRLIIPPTPSQWRKSAPRRFGWRIRCSTKSASSSITTSHSVTIRTECRSGVSGMSRKARLRARCSFFFRLPELATARLVLAVERPVRGGIPERHCEVPPFAVPIPM